MGFVVGVPYYVIDATDYAVLCSLLGESFVAGDGESNSLGFQAYTDPNSHVTYYVTLQSNIDQAEDTQLANCGFPSISFNTTYFTTSTQANIPIP